MKTRPKKLQYLCHRCRRTQDAAPGPWVMQFAHTRKLRCPLMLSWVVLCGDCDREAELVAG